MLYWQRWGGWGRWVVRKCGSKLPAGVVRASQLHDDSPVYRRSQNDTANWCLVRKIKPVSQLGQHPTPSFKPWHVLPSFISFFPWKVLPYQTWKTKLFEHAFTHSENTCISHLCYTELNSAGPAYSTEPQWILRLCPWQSGWTVRYSY